MAVKKALHIDELLLAAARRASGASTDTDTVRLGLEALVRQRRLHGRGIGWVDAHLLASALVARFEFATADVRLAAVARDLGISHG